MLSGPLPSVSQLQTVARLGWPSLLTPPPRIEPSAGGLGAPVVWKLSTTAGEYSLRRWGHDQTAHASRVAHLLAHVDSRLPHLVPVPLPAHNDAPFFAHGPDLWELAPWLPGRSDFEASPSLERVASAAESLAELHLSLAEIAASEGPTRSVVQKCERQLAEVLSLFEGDWPDEGSDAMRQWGWPIALLPVERTLPGACALAAGRITPLRTTLFPRQWVWGDAWHRNILFEGTQVTGLVDFAAARIDVPAADLARLLGSTCTGRPAWREAGLAAYGKVRSLGPAERVLTKALEDVATVVSLGNWCRWLAIEKQAVAHPQLVRDRLSHFTCRLAALIAAE